MELISDYDIRVGDCGFTIKFLCSTLSKAYYALGIKPPSKTPPPLSCQASPLKSVKCPSRPPFLGNSPLYIVFFVNPPSFKIQLFS